MTRSTNVLCFLIFACSTPCFADKAIEVVLAGKRQQLLPLGHTSRSVSLLRRNGQLLTVKPDELVDPKIVSRFRPFSQSEMRGELLQEFGKGFDVSGTGNYLVVHPKGARDLWAGRFEQLYRSMTHFFQVRGYRMKRPEFPLVGIVFHSRDEYLAYLQRSVRFNGASSIGVYVPQTNRIYLYDATAGSGTKSREWENNLGTIMHEAAHQTAFNTGVHVRLAETPRWLGEGLGCLFEARGIYDSSHYRNREDRINYVRLMSFKQNVNQDAAKIINDMIATDKPFQYDPERAYAAAWALTFYLSEREPRKYIRYLRTVSKHQPLQKYNSATRQKEFAALFGRDSRMVGARVSRFMDELPVPRHLQQ